MRNRSCRVLALAFVLVATSVVAPAEAVPNKQAAVAYHDEWRKLFEDHVTWTRMVILGVVHALPSTGAYTDRLIQNYVDMEDALEPYFAAEDVEELGDLLLDHLVVAKQILDTVKAGGDPAALIDAWRQNSTDIATKMSEMTGRWPFGAANEMWQEHLTHTLDEALAIFAGNAPADIAAYDEVHDLALEMADFFSRGVIRGKAQFKREVCVP